MDDAQSMDLVIEDRAGPLSILEFTQFLTEFRAVYSLALGAIANHTIDPELAVSNGAVVADYLRGMQPEFLRISMDGATRSLLGTELYFLDIQRVNPIKITLKGSITALAAAVLICGGTVEADPKRGILIASTPGLAQSMINIAKAFKALSASPTNSDNNQISASDVPSATGRTMSKNSSKKN